MRRMTEDNIMVAGVVGAMLLWLTCVGGLVYVAIHFISKFW